MSHENTESILYVETLIVKEKNKIRVLNLIDQYKGYEENILKLLKTSF